MRQKIVISGINLYQGGPLSIYTDLLDELIKKEIYLQYEITIFVHKYDIFSKYSSCFEIVELPKSRESWFKRIYYEYIYFHNYSKQRDIYLWIALHDITPRVHSQYLVTYCHNPTPFFKSTIKDFNLDKTVFLFSKFYKYLYSINIRKNTFVIVQQEWMRKEFERIYNINNVVQFPPRVNIDYQWDKGNKKSNKNKIFFYPSLPRVFKNFEIVCEAIKYLQENYNTHCEFIITIDGSENKYSRHIYKKYKDVEGVKFIGLQTRQEVYKMYDDCDALIFPSRLETWGLPITEFKQTGKTIFLSDLPYAHETLGSYENAVFFNCENYIELAKHLKNYIDDKMISKSVLYSNENKNVIESWEEIIALNKISRRE